MRDGTGLRGRRCYGRVPVVVGGFVATFTLQYTVWTWVALDADTSKKAVAAGQSQSGCATIKDGTLTDSAGNPLVLGFDQFGYNYQAHLFNGTYDGSDRTLDGTYRGTVGDFVDDRLRMKWSDDWLANKDCTGDGKLDRGSPSSDGYPVPDSDNT